MPLFEVDYTYSIREGGAINTEAVDQDEAERLALTDIKDMYDDVTDIKIEAVREIKE